MATRRVFRDKDGNFVRELTDGRSIMAYPITLGRARVSIGPTDGMGYDDTW